ncbi:acetoin dehydrogenase dihydrolipoyllysine-residue acetyltransferase subunit [Dinoroseobacter sp. S76]|uniref:acetoin dehydrogenase dihydrolipoyllysine-residue acetyltransferase subunit n=1 Tax=Dinoroseobacter sp. S76 TaxID=3415124 RepID=UPI003C7AA2F1
MTTLAKLTLPMPRLGETMEEATVAEWLVAPGQSFKRGDPLLEVETDKTMVEYPALGNGTLLAMLVAPGDVVTVGTPIAEIETADPWDGIEGEADPEPPEPAPAMARPIMAPVTAAPANPARLRATPLARRIARESGLALDGIPGTGRRGRIEAADVRALIPGAIPLAAPRNTRAAATAPVYCVHGFAGLGANWAALRADLQRSGLSSSAPDLPGHGRNPAEVSAAMDLVDWLAEDLARQPAPVHLLGHSLGAWVAARAAQRAPERVARLTLLAPAGCGLEIHGGFLTSMAAAPGPGELAHLMRLLGPKASALDSAALSAMAQELRGQRLAALSRDMARGDTQRIDTLGPLRALAGQMPITAIFGLADRIIPRAHAFHLPPHVACHMVETGHMPHWDATADVAAILAAP